jgi:hypothetical protein
VHVGHGRRLVERVAGAAAVLEHVQRVGLPPGRDVAAPLAYTVTS